MATRLGGWLRCSDGAARIATTRRWPAGFWPWVDRKMLWPPVASSDHQGARVLAVVKARLATLGPRLAGLTALTTALRTLVRTGFCLSVPNPRPQDVAVDDLFRFVRFSDDR